MLSVSFFRFKGITMDKERLAAAIFSTAHITGEFKLRSGQTSREYFDKYLFESQPALLKEIAQQMLPLISKNIDALAGLEMGGIPIATMLSQLSGLPVVFVRKKAKDYGTCRLAEGGDIQGKRLLIVEDVVTSGGQILLSAADLRARQALVDHVVCVIDREEGGTEKLAEQELLLKPLFRMSELKAAAGENGS